MDFIHHWIVNLGVDADIAIYFSTTLTIILVALLCICCQFFYEKDCCPYYFPYGK